MHLMNSLLTRRNFLGRLATASGAALAPSLPRASASSASSAPKFSFVLLGDLHFDKLEHHDLAWLDRTHPNDLSQIKNFADLPPLAKSYLKRVEELTGARISLLGIGPAREQTLVA